MEPGLATQLSMNEKTLHKFCNYARNVWDFEGEDSMELATKGIDATENFFKECGIPMTLKEAGIEEKSLHDMAVATTNHNDMGSCYVGLSTEDIEIILKNCF